MMNNSIYLSWLLADFIAIPKESDRLITGIALDSRKVQPGDLFCAYQGYKEDGAKYIEAAIQNGAVAVICDDNKLERNCLVPLFFLANLHNIVGELAAKFYHYPAHKMTIVGVTGTNGKTSITQFIARALARFNKKCGVIGTLGIGFPDHLVATGLTTPDAITIQKTLADLLQNGAEAVAVEASSHSLAQNRLEAVNPQIAVFTNLTRDHLDYHTTMKNYFSAKLKLFQMLSVKFALINVDDEYASQLIQALPEHVQAFGYSIEGKSLDIPMLTATKISILSHGFTAEIKTPWGEGSFRSSLLGRFNIANLLAVLGVLCLMDINFKDALQSLEQLTTVPGRMVTIKISEETPLVVVDYSHTPDALEKALSVLHEHCSGKIWCVFGCGGDRDRGKRPIMGQIAERCSDHFIITNDNPRTEDPKQIVADILSGLAAPEKAVIEYDRGKAIRLAIHAADANDVVLIAGKGHENYQILGGETIHFDDVEEARAALGQEHKIQH